MLHDVRINEFWCFYYYWLFINVSCGRFVVFGKNFVVSGNEQINSDIDVRKREHR